jgi:hypothetical protein
MTMIMISKKIIKGTIIAKSVDVALFFPLSSEPAWLAVWVPIASIA